MNAEGSTTNLVLDDAAFTRLFGQPLRDLTPDRAFELACLLGGLARWWLRPEVLALAEQVVELLPEGQQELWRQIPTELPEGRGICWPIFVNVVKQRLPLLKPALVFPLRWEQREYHDPRLPPSLTLLADQVRRQADDARENVDGWCLAPATDSMLGRLDLSQLNLKCESAWASLAGGLVIASRHGRPRLQVWVSAQWVEGKGLEPVSGLDDKVELVRELGGTALYVPKQQALDAAALLPPEHITPEVASLNETPGPERPMGALRAYLDKHWQMPTRESPREERVGYFLRYFASADAARSWYIEHCLPDTVDDLRKMLESRPIVRQVTHLVLDLSPSFELLAMAVAVIRPLRCALIVDAEMQKNVQKAKELIAKFVPPAQCTVRAFETSGQSVDELLQEYRKILGVFTQGVTDPRQLMIDVSPGPKHCNITMLRAAPKGCQVMYYAGGFDPATRRTPPFTQRPELWMNKTE